MVHNSVRKSKAKQDIKAVETTLEADFTEQSKEGSDKVVVFGSKAFFLYKVANLRKVVLTFERKETDFADADVPCKTVY